MAAQQDKLVYVPDRRDPMSFPGSMTTEEIRRSLVATGYTAVENADAVEGANGSITFRRPTGGTKGL